MKIPIPVERPRCRKCRSQMTLIGVAPDGSQETFECRKCDRLETRDVSKDPMNQAAGWINSGLYPPK